MNGVYFCNRNSTITFVNANSMAWIMASGSFIPSIMTHQYIPKMGVH